MAQQSSSPHAHTILLAEDDPAIAEVVTIVLKEAGHSVIHVTSVEEILSTTNEKQVCLLLLDVWFSGSNVSLVGKQLKKESKTRHIPIILSSGSPEIQDIAEEMDADGILPKPFDIEVLIQKVMKHAL